jgi:hypothetical protein
MRLLCPEPRPSGRGNSARQPWMISPRFRGRGSAGGRLPAVGEIGGGLGRGQLVEVPDIQHARASLRGAVTSATGADLSCPPSVPRAADAEQIAALL